KNHQSKTDLDDILIVDDESANLQLLSELLGREGYQVRPANNPQLALDSALAQPPKLILLDVKMPEMDGFEVCRRLKQDQRTRDIPILFVSALQDVQDRVRGFEVGGVDFISKPFQEEEVLARVRTHMSLHNMQRNLEKMVAKRTAELESEIGERRQAEKKLIKSEAKYRGLVDNSIIGVFTTTLDGRFTFVNEAMAQIFDFGSTEQMIARGSLERWSDLKDRERMLAGLQKHGSVTNFEAEAITNTDRNIHVLFSARQIGNNILGMVMDITERKQNEQKIRAYQQRLQALASQLTIAEEKERRAIAADLHDHVGQTLALARMQLASARKSTTDSKLADELDNISDSLLKSLEDTQQLMLELSSPAMNQSGLSSAISEWLAAQIENKHNIKSEFIDNIPKNQIDTLDANYQTILFRNVRELLVNVVKHARANKVSVRLEDRNSTMRIIIEDDGIGFEPHVVTPAGSKIGGYGLFSIEQLMADLGGSLRIVSRPGRGCTAILSAPYSVEDEQQKR
ncbi:MAG: response regulator, partial [Desulfobacterales bacterium]